jgi:hypothetical protein
VGRVPAPPGQLTEEDSIPKWRQEAWNHSDAFTFSRLAGRYGVLRTYYDSTTWAGNVDGASLFLPRAGRGGVVLVCCERIGNEDVDEAPGAGLPAG